MTNGPTVDVVEGRSPRRSIVVGAVSAIIAVPLAAAVISLAWKFPVLMVGERGRSLDAAIGAAGTALAYMTVLSMLSGLVTTAVLGGVVGYLLRHRPYAWTVASTFLVALVAAAGVAIAADSYSNRGPGWVDIHVGQVDIADNVDGEPRSTMRDLVGEQVTVKNDDGRTFDAVTGSQGWATIKVPAGDYRVTTRCGGDDAQVTQDERVSIGISCPPPGR